MSPLTTMVPGLGHGVGQAGANALDLALAQADGLGEAHGAANGRRRGQIAHDDLAAGAMQANGDASGDVARASNLNEHGLSHPWCVTIVLMRCHRSVCTRTTPHLLGLTIG